MYFYSEPKHLTLIIIYIKIDVLGCYNRKPNTIFKKKRKPNTQKNLLMQQFQLDSTMDVLKMTTRESLQLTTKWSMLFSFFQHKTTMLLTHRKKYKN